MKKLTVEVDYSPKELAEICRKHGAGSSQFSFACCPFPGAGCPLEVDQKTCGETTSEDWEKVLQDEEPKPEFRFGDKVRIVGKECGTLKGFFAYSESEDGGWFMVEGYRVLVFTKFKYVKTDWE